MKHLFFKAALTFTIFFGVLAFLFSKTIYLSFQDAEDLYAEDFDIIKHGEGGHISTEIYASLGDCASETTTTKKNGSITSSSTKYYYVVPAFDLEGETYYICVEVKSEDRSVYNTITNNTWDYLEGYTDYIGEKEVSFDGTIEELDDELYDYMLEWFREAEAYETESELRAHVLQLCLVPMEFDSANTYIIVLVVFFAIAALFWILYFVGRSKARTRSAAATNGMAMSGMNGGASLNGVPVGSATPQYSADPYNTQYNNNAQYNNNYNTQYGNDPYNMSGSNTDYNTQNNQYNSFQNINNTETVAINGIAYPKASLAQVNSYVLSGEKVKAIAALRDVSGLSLAEAKNVVDNWNQIYQ